MLSKPAGLLMHALPNKASEEPLVTDWVAAHYPETRRVGDEPEVRPGLLHRLDRDTSGIFLVARNGEFFAYAKDLFQRRLVRKTYLALVRGHVDRPRNIIRKPIGIRSGTTRRSVRSSKMVKDAETEYELLELCTREGVSGEEPVFKSSLLKVTPHTGRTHQIRVHMTAIGHPVLGDPLYGPALQPDWVTRLMLHALALEFEHPSGTRLSFTAPPDEEFGAAVGAAGGSIYPHGD